MTRLLVVFVFMLLGSLAVVNARISAQWEQGLKHVACTEGSVSPLLPSRCALLGEGLTSTGPTAEAEDMADWLIDFVLAMSDADVDSVLAVVDPGNELDLTGAELRAMSREDLIALIGDVQHNNPTLYAQLVAAQAGVDVVACKKKKKTWSACDNGYECKLPLTCTDKNGNTKTCVTQFIPSQEPACSACANGTCLTWICNDPCVPTPNGRLLIAAAFVFAWVAVRLRRIGPVSE